jgi:single-stranded-DNA-specific exonuclease
MDLETRSARQRLWRLATPAPEDVRAQVEADVPHALAPILAARGVDPADARDVLHPSLRRQMPNPSRFKDMDLASERVARAVRAQERVLVWGDYDVDGATSTAVLVRFLRQVGLEVEIHIPDRMSEGYGLNTPQLEAAAARGIELVVVLDAGTVNFAEIDAANAAGLEVVVVDHHAAEPELPAAVAVVNPNRQDEDGAYGHLCAAGMTFLLAVAVNARLRDSGYLEAEGLTTDLMRLLDLVALGTVADVVPLTGLNRAYVARGLDVMNRLGNPGLAALAQTGGIEPPLSGYHCGFVLGPRINAGGRVGQADVGARLLASGDPRECAALAQSLDAWNKDRQEMEKTCVAAAREQVGDDPAPGAVMAVGEDWHEGVIGIVASRLKDAYDRVAFCFTRAEDGLLKGSARSMAGFDLGSAVIEARKQGLLAKGGGHAMAAGVSVAPDKLEAFRAFVDARIAESEFARLGVVTDLDLALPGERLSAGLVEAFEALQPFGVGNARPRVLVHSVQLLEADMLNDKARNPAHLRLTVATPDGRRIKAIAFNVAGTPLPAAAQGLIGHGIELAGTLDIDNWRGRNDVQIKLDDLRGETGLAQDASRAA